MLVQESAEDFRTANNFLGGQEMYCPEQLLINHAQQ